MRHSIAWTVGHSKQPDTKPEKFVPATVPGAVQLDWAKAENWPDHTIADNWRAYGWIEDVYWLYRGKLTFAPLKNDERLFFVCKGIDYRYQIRVKNELLYDYEGMFAPVELDLTGRVSSGDDIEVLVFPAPKSMATPVDRNQANQSCKPAVSYSWDFHPRLIPLGIWDETYLETRPAVHLKSAEVVYELTPDLKSAEVALDARLNSSGSGKLRWKLIAPDKSTVFEQVVGVSKAQVLISKTVDAPALWWPSGQGEASLYTSVVELLDNGGAVLDSRESRIGFRRVRLVMHPDAWEYPHPTEFPKSRSHPPITMEINGRRIFCKGSNWVSPDIFPGTITHDTYRSILSQVKAANMNILRCWGGAIVQKDAFFELCDELGIMVWQEFPLACNRYEGTPSYLRVLDGESKAIIQRLRQHPALVIWCGGNELFNAWSLMTDQDLALRLLNRNCYDLDPQRPFLMTSPVDGMGHGHYVFRSREGKEVFQLFATANCTAYTEFGVGGPSSVEILKRIIPPADLFPPKLATAWETHHALAAWQPNSHLLLDVIEDYFGPCESVEQIVERGQLMQGEGLRCLFEEARRQKPHSAMALNWCLNEPWPTAANLSIMNWPAQPKPAFKQVTNACRPVLASAKIRKFLWLEGELFDPELWILNDDPKSFPAGAIEVSAAIGDQETFLLRWDHLPIEANTNLQGPVVRFKLPKANGTKLILKLRRAKQSDWNSEYTLLYRSTEQSKAIGTRRMNQ
jgi:beta-mannosidase